MMNKLDRQRSRAVPFYLKFMTDELCLKRSVPKFHPCGTSGRKLTPNSVVDIKISCNLYNKVFFISFVALILILPSVLWLARFGSDISTSNAFVVCKVAWYSVT